MLMPHEPVFSYAKTPRIKGRHTAATGGRDAYGVTVSRAMASIWNIAAAFILFLMLAVNARAQAQGPGPKLAVINTAGEVWARDLSANTVGPGMKLTGPGLFGGPDDQFVVASADTTIAVVTKSGDFWPRQVTDTTISQPSHPSGSLFGGPDAKYVLYDGSLNVVYVVNTKGQVWSHVISTTDGIPTTVGGSTERPIVVWRPKRQICCFRRLPYPRDKYRRRSVGT
jgi:hypothetical protein